MATKKKKIKINPKGVLSSVKRRNDALAEASAPIKKKKKK